MANSDHADVRQLFMHAYTAHLQTHGRLIIGLAVILLTVLQIRPFLIDPWNKNICLLLGLYVRQGDIFYFCVLVVAFAFWFVVMRHFVYGHLVDAIMEVELAEKEKDKSSRKQMAESVAAYVHNRRILTIIPDSFFYGKWSLKRMFGLLLCFAMASVTTRLIYVLMG